MIKFESLRQYVHVVNGIRYTQNPKKPFLLVYYSENSNLLVDYPKLNIRTIDAKYVVAPVTRIPRTLMTPDMRKIYKNYGLLPYSIRQKVPSTKNIILDTTQYLNAIDNSFHVKNYRQRGGFLIKNLLLNLFTMYPDNYQKVFLYSIDATKPMNSFINRKIFPILQELKDKNVYYDHMIYTLIGESSSRHRLLIKDRDYKFNRIFQIMKTVKLSSTEEEIVDDIKNAEKIVVDKVKDNISPDNIEKIKTAVSNFLADDPESLEKITTHAADQGDIERIAAAAVLHRISGDKESAKRIAKAIPKGKEKTALKAINKNYLDSLLETHEPVSLSNDLITKLIDVPKVLDGKSPEHLFQKRQIDFEKNLKNDIKKSFGVLEKKDVPLKIDKIEIIDKKQPLGELKKSDVSTVKVVLLAKGNKKHTVNIDVPKIDLKSGTFLVNGQRKCLINQIVLCPISFPKPHDSRFQGSYGTFHVTSKRTKRLKYLEIRIGSYSYKLPFFPVLCLAFGFEQTIKTYGLDYEIVEKVEKDSKSVKIKNGQYLLFKNINSELKEEIYSSCLQTKFDKYNITSEFGTPKYFDNLIIKMTGRVNAPFLINGQVENIVDPAAKQVLINQRLPYEMELIIKYMATKVVEGTVQDRNDISNQRIKGSEVIVHLIHKQLLAAHTEYKEQYLSGNKDAKFNLLQGKVLTEFIMSEIVTDMEYANPMEEMATLTRVSPVGKSLGGIPGKEAIQASARDVHESYFGNIDPVDTPEGDNIGIVQHLSIDAFITSERGLFLTKEHNDKEGIGLLSTTSALIPFLENNDGARVMMAVNQARQVVTLKNPEAPIIQSGFESVLTNVVSDKFIKKSPCDGKVLAISDYNITVHCRDGKKQRIDISPEHLKSGSGKNTLSVFKPKVEKGQRVKKNQVLAEGGCISNGSIALGRTLCVAVMPYKGYNFEDGIVINEALVDEDKLTSLHGEIEEVLVAKTDRILFLAKVGDTLKKGEPLIQKTIGEIEDLLGFDEEHEGAELSGGHYIKKSPGGKIVDIEIFSNVAPSTFPKLKDIIERTRRRSKVPADKSYTVKGQKIEGMLVRFKIEQELKIKIGDKLNNRFGAKGVIALIEKDNLMPRTPWGDRIDIILNPIGIISRMNMGQLYELYTGLISKFLARAIVKSKSKSQVIALMKQVLGKLDTTKNNELSTKLVSKIQALPATQFKKLIAQIEETDSVPIIIPPFKSPTYKSIGEALKILGLKTGYELKLPEYNTKTKNPVPVGFMYIQKLEHIAEEKAHSRSTGRITGKTGQPTAGKRQDGGGKLGELDTYSFISYDCPAVLAEFFGPLSDDHISKNELISSVVQTGEAEYLVPKISPARDLLHSYFISLMLSG